MFYLYSIKSPNELRKIVESATEVEKILTCLYFVFVSTGIQLSLA